MRVMPLFFMIFVLFPSLSAASEITEGRIAYWDFNGNVNDLSGYNHNGTIHGNPVFESSQFDSSLYFDGSGDYVTVADHADLDFSSSFTFIFWINPASTMSTYGRHLIGKWDTASSDRAYSVTIGRTYNIPGAGADNIVMFLSSTGSNLTFLSSEAGVIVPDEWQQVAYVFGSSTLTLFLNGIPVAQKSYAATLHNSSDDLALGALNSSGAYSYKGYMDEVSLYNRALSDTEVMAHYSYVIDEKYNLTNSIPEPSTIVFLLCGLFASKLHMIRKSI